MLLGSLLRLLAAAVFAFFVYRLLGAVARGLSGRTGARHPGCVKCRGTGWIALEGATRRACDCGAAVKNADGPVIDLTEER